MTKTDLYEMVRDYLQRPNQSTASIDSMASMVEAKINTVLRRHPRMYAYETLTLDSEGTADLPDDINSAAVLRDGDGKIPQYPPQLRGTFNRGAIFFGQEVNVTGSSGEIVLEYYRMLPPLAENDDNWVLTYFPDAYLYGILSESRVYLRDDQRLATFKQLFEERLANLERQGWNQNFTNARRVTVSA